MKRILSLIIVLATVLCMIPVSMATATAAEADFVQVDLTGYADGDTYIDGNGVKYEVIRTEANFKAIDRTKNCILACDINFNEKVLNGTYFGDGTSIQGIIDGNGYALYNFSVNYTGSYGTIGLLAQSLKGNAAIRNLSIGKPSEIIDYKINGASANTTGCLVGKINETTTADQTVTISNVHIYCNITFMKPVANGVTVGALVGMTHNDSNNQNTYTVNISDCSFTGSVKFDAAATTSGQNTRIGGMVGYHKIGTLNISNCVNNADLDLTNRDCGSNSSFVGGMVGNAQSPANFTNCVNTGDLISDEYSGGIVGAVSYNNSTTHAYSFKKCTNYGNVTANSADLERRCTAGGIIGLANFGTYSFDQCGNTGTISSSYIYDAASNPKLGACGIIGRYWLDNSNTVISNCYSTGVIASAIENDTRNYKVYALFMGGGSSSAVKLKITDCVWNVESAENKVVSGMASSPSADSTGNEEKNIIAKYSQDAVDAYIQKSNDNTKIRVILVTKSELLEGEDVVIKVFCGNTGRKFTVPANQVFAMETVDAAGEIYYGIDGANLFGAVITGIPTDTMDAVTDVTVEYGEYTFDFNMQK